MTILETLRQFNWVDIFFVILFIRICYVSVRNGFFAELFRLLGTVAAIYLSLHYYIDLSDYAGTIIGAKKLPLEFLSFISFISLVLLGYIIFALTGRFISRFFKAEAAPRLNRWGSLLLGMIRSLLLMSLIIFIFTVAPVGYFKNSVVTSYSGRRLVGIAPQTYALLWNGIISKFRTQEEFNDTVLSVREEFGKQ